jgi:hypothetical protein
LLNALWQAGLLAVTSSETATAGKPDCYRADVT